MTTVPATMVAIEAEQPGGPEMLKPVVRSEPQSRPGVVVDVWNGVPTDPAANDQAKVLWKEMERFWRQRAIVTYLRSEGAPDPQNS